MGWMHIRRDANVATGIDSLYAPTCELRLDDILAFVQKILIYDKWYIVIGDSGMLLYFPRLRCVEKAVETAFPDIADITDLDLTVFGGFGVPERITVFEGKELFGVNVVCCSRVHVG